MENTAADKTENKRLHASDGMRARYFRNAAEFLRERGGKSN